MVLEKTYDREFLASALYKMQLGRKFEERVQWLFSQGLVHGTTHLGIGEEATATGVMLAMEKQDYIFGTHRGHIQALARGIELNGIMAEILAKGTGVCRGMGGSMHIGDPTIGYFTCDGVLGANAVIANGIALGIKKKGEKDRLVAVFMGDGTTNEGAVFEAFNLANIWNLPTLFICVNNTYGMSTPIAKVMKDTDITKRAIPFDMPAENVDGNDVLAVYEATVRARKYIVENQAPMLLVLNTYRTSGHSKSDGNAYRTKEEIAMWKERCPIKRFKAYMLEHGFKQEELDAVEEKVVAEIEASVEYAKSCPEPTMEVVYDGIYA